MQHHYSRCNFHVHNRNAWKSCRMANHADCHHSEWQNSRMVSSIVIMMPSSLWSSSLCSSCWACLCCEQRIIGEPSGDGEGPTRSRHRNAAAAQAQGQSPRPHSASGVARTLRPRPSRPGFEFGRWKKFTLSSSSAQTCKRFFIG